MTTRPLFGNDIDHPRNIETTSGSRSLATAGGARTSQAPTSTSTRFKVPSPFVRQQSPLTHSTNWPTTHKMQPKPVHIIAGRGISVVLHEMRPVCTTAVHKTSALAELVCSNSFRSDDKEHNAVGLLHEEMRRLGSLVMRAADSNQVPAGGALAVDRDGFSAAITAALAAHPLVQIRREEIAGLPPPDWDKVIVATGPLTSPALAEAIGKLTGEDALAFFDAIAPIVHRDSTAMSNEAR